MPNPLIIAVDTIGHHTVMGPVVSTAVAFSTETQEPVFRYKDGRGAQRYEMLLRKSEQIPDSLSLAIKTYLHKIALGIANTCCTEQQARTEGYDVVRNRLVQMAVLRLLERLQYTHPELKGIGLNQITVSKTSPLLTLELPPQITLVDLSERDWRLNSARFLAKIFREDQLVHDTLKTVLNLEKK